MRISEERLRQAREFIDQYDRLERKGADVVAWLSLKFSCNRRHAQELYDAAVKSQSIDLDEG